MRHSHAHPESKIDWMKRSLNGKRILIVGLSRLKHFHQVFQFSLLNFFLSLDDNEDGVKLNNVDYKWIFPLNTANIYFSRLQLKTFSYPSMKNMNIRNLRAGDDGRRDGNFSSKVQRTSCTIGNLHCSCTDHWILIKSILIHLTMFCNKIMRFHQWNWITFRIEYILR
jgi:hypothetical protein